MNQAAENAAKKIGLYEDFEDDVYGGFHRINKRGNPSVQRDADNSTINDFDPPKDKNGLRKTKTPLFEFKDNNLSLVLISNPVENESHLELLPMTKSNQVSEGTQFIEYLRADDDNLVLTDGIRSYLLASRFNAIPEFDE